MAAATFPTTKGLSLIFTLLCLVCFTNSLTDKDMLDKFREDFERLQHETARMWEDPTVDAVFPSEFLDDLMALLDPLMVIAKKTVPDFVPLLDFLEHTKTFVKASKIYLDKEKVVLPAGMRQYTQYLKFLKKLLTDLERNRNEL